MVCARALRPRVPSARLCARAGPPAVRDRRADAAALAGLVPDARQPARRRRRLEGGPLAMAIQAAAPLATYVGRVGWLWRNPGYGFDVSALGFLADPKATIAHRGPSALGGALVTGWYFAVVVNPDGARAWQFYAVKVWGSRAMRVDFGWSSGALPAPASSLCQSIRFCLPRGNSCLVYVSPGPREGGGRLCPGRVPDRPRRLSRVAPLRARGRGAQSKARRGKSSACQ